jgi:hypothetical protein
VFGPRARVVWRLVVLLTLIALATLALSGELGPLRDGALTMLPALALAVMMLTRPYLGERLIARLQARRRRRPRTLGPVATHQRPHALVARGGCLIAMALAGRAPPIALAGGR